MPVDYKDLETWKKSMELVKACYILQKRLPVEERYGLCDQIRRAVVSIPANIAEGHGRATNKEFAKFLGYSRGSLYEVETEVLTCVSLGYLTEIETKEVFALIKQVAKMLNSLIKKVNDADKRTSG